MGDLRQRNYVIDFAKAIAIVLVVIGHWYPTTSPAWWIGIRDVIYSFHMPLFMAASGYIYIYIKELCGAKLRLVPAWQGQAIDGPVYIDINYCNYNQTSHAGRCLC